MGNKEKPSISFKLTFIDGSVGYWDSGLTELKSAIATLRAQRDFNIDGEHIMCHAIFSWKVHAEE